MPAGRDLAAAQILAERLHAFMDVRCCTHIAAESQDGRADFIGEELLIGIADSRSDVVTNIKVTLYAQRLHEVVNSLCRGLRVVAGRGFVGVALTGQIYGNSSVSVVQQRLHPAPGVGRLRKACNEDDRRSGTAVDDVESNPTAFNEAPGEWLPAQLDHVCHVGLPETERKACLTPGWIACDAIM